MKVVCINNWGTKLLKVGDVYTVVDDYRCGCRLWYRLAEAESWKPSTTYNVVTCKVCKQKVPYKVVGMYHASRFVPLDGGLLSVEDKQTIWNDIKGKEPA